ncbi:unnamed protein product, partial [Porites evermanni]
ATHIPAPDLDKLLCSFFKDLRKKDASDYKLDMVSSFQKSIQRHITEQKLPFNILKDEAFSRSRSVLAAKRKSLVKEGRGNKPNASREGSKMRQGLEGGHQGQFCPKAFATGTNRCPVLYYKLFK